MSEKFSGKNVTPNIVFCPDGVYRWYYEFNMLKNPTIFITVSKVLLLSVTIVYAFVLILIIHNGEDLEEIIDLTKGFVLIYLFMLFLGLISYLIIAMTYGGKYMVLFEMNEKQISHIQMQKQFKKAQAIGWLTSIVGAASGNIGTIGQGILASSKYSSTSVFKNVESVIVKRGRNTIYLNQLLNKNQIYVYDEDFNFLVNFIQSHCIKAKIR